MLSTKVFYEATERDDEARRRYNTLRAKWDLRDRNSPSNDCLAIARDFYCKTSFPKCNDSNGEDLALCEHTCETWKLRCAKEEDNLCDNPTSEDECTFAMHGQNLTLATLATALALIMLS